MTNQYDGPRADAPVKVVQAAKPTRLTQAEAEELFRITEAATDTAFASANAMATYGTGSAESEAARQAAREAYGALLRWQLAHGLSLQTVTGSK